MANNAKIDELATFTEIGDAIGVSYEQARRIYNKAVYKIKRDTGAVHTSEIKELLQHLDSQETDAEFYDITDFRKCSSVGRALFFQIRCRRFEPGHLLQRIR